MEQFKKLLAPIQIQGKTIRNRMVVSAMVSNYAEESGAITERLRAYYTAKAKGGWGLVITEDLPVNPTAGKYSHLPTLFTEEHIQQYHTLTEEMHEAGAVVLAQIYHGGQRAVTKYVPSIVHRADTPSDAIEMTHETMDSLRQDFVNCALAARKAGFDGVEIHGGHGYLLSLFQSSLTNKRGDNYGGTLRNRMRYPVEIVRSIREAVGENFIICYRLTSNEYTMGGVNPEEAKAMAMMLEAAGVDLLNITQGSIKQSYIVIPPSCVPHGYYIDNAAAVRQAVSIPVIGAGRINDPYIAEEILRTEKADMVVMARASLADPELPNKVKEGRLDDITQCIGCLQGCTGQNAIGKSLRCTVNPMTGRESEYDLRPVENPKTVLVVGGGIAGCETAIVAARRGHRVTLIEKSDRLGGQWLAAAVPLGKAEFSSFVSWQSHTLAKLGVDVRLNTALNQDVVSAIAPQVVVLATGGTPVVPPIPGHEMPHVSLATDVLMGKRRVGKNVVVIGGGLVGTETAIQMAYTGSRVTIVEMLPEIARDAERNVKHYLKQHIQEYHIQVYTSASVKKIGGDFLELEKDGKPIQLAGITDVVMAAGFRTNKQPAEELAQYFQGDVICVGDASTCKNGYANIQEGFEAGLRI